MISPVLFTTLLVLLTLLQTSFLPVPWGLLAILIGLVFKGFGHSLVYALIFSTLLGIIANIPIWIIFLATMVSLYLFIAARQIVPARFGLSLVSIVVSVSSWEIVTLLLTRLVDI